MSLSRYELSSSQALLAGLFVAQLTLVTAETRISFLDVEIVAVQQEPAIASPAIASPAIASPAMDYRAAAQAMAEYQSTEMMTLSHGAVWENSYPAASPIVSLEDLEGQKKRLEEVAHDLEGTDEVLRDIRESTDQERPAVEVIPNDLDNQVEDPKLAELLAIQKQERDSAEYQISQRRQKLEDRLADAAPEVRQAHLKNFEKVATDAADQLAARHTAELDKLKHPPSGPAPPHR